MESKTHLAKPCPELVTFGAIDSAAGFRESRQIARLQAPVDALYNHVGAVCLNTIPLHSSFIACRSGPYR